LFYPRISDPFAKRLAEKAAEAGLDFEDYIDKRKSKKYGLKWSAPSYADSNSTSGGGLLKEGYSGKNNGYQRPESFNLIDYTDKVVTTKRQIIDTLINVPMD